jgi:Rhodopirellula transposase DDE domain
MDDSDDIASKTDDLLRLAARSLTGHRRRRFQAEVTRELCSGHARQAERRFGWGRANVETGLHELDSGIRCVSNVGRRGQRRSEDANPQLAADIRALAEPHTQADPELKSERRYTNLSARELLERLRTEKGYADADLPSERTMRDIMNRMDYRLKRIQKGKPLKKTVETDAIFANVKAVREQVKDDAGTLELSMDTKAKVNEGEYARGGKNADGVGRDGGEGTGP